VLAHCVSKCKLDKCSRTVVKILAMCYGHDAFLILGRAKNMIQSMVLGRLMLYFDLFSSVRMLHSKSFSLLFTHFPLCCLTKTRQIICSPVLGLLLVFCPVFHAVGLIFGLLHSLVMCTFYVPCAPVPRWRFWTFQLHNLIHKIFVRELSFLGSFCCIRKFVLLSLLVET
jgi:hypothetical protein